MVLGVPVHFKQSAESVGIWGYRGFRRVIEPEASGTMDWFFQDLTKMFQVHNDMTLASCYFKNLTKQQGASMKCT